MPRYFIDTSDQRHFVRDDFGGNYRDLEAAKAAAVDVLPDMARDELPDGDSRSFLAIVRSEDGDTLLQASLHLEVTHLLPRSAIRAAGHKER
jgi:hypothetical protein